MDTLFLREEAVRFLDRIWFVDSELLEVRALTPFKPGVERRFCVTREHVLREVGWFSGRANTYLGACPRYQRGGTREAIRTVTAAWCDLDYHQIDEDRAVAERVGLDRLLRFRYRPSIVVATGNGLQAYWIYDRPVRLSEEWPAERFEAINLMIAEDLGGDHVHDLPRVLRIPGTWNLPDARKRARGCVPVMSRLLWADGPNVSVEALDALVPTRTAETVREATPPSVPTQPLAPGHLDALLEAFRSLLDRLGPDHRLTRTWFGRRTPRDGSRSGFDWALATELARLNVTPDAAVAILRFNPKGKNSEARDRYLVRTVERAYERHQAAR